MQTSTSLRLDPSLCPGVSPARYVLYYRCLDCQLSKYHQHPHLPTKQPISPLTIDQPTELTILTNQFLFINFIIDQPTNQFHQRWTIRPTNQPINQSISLLTNPQNNFTNDGPSNQTTREQVCGMEDCPPQWKVEGWTKVPLSSYNHHYCK